MEIFSYFPLEEQTFNDVTRFLGEPKWMRKQTVGFLFRGQEENAYEPATLESKAKVYWIFKRSSYAAQLELQHCSIRKLLTHWQGPFPKVQRMLLSFQDF